MNNIGIYKITSPTGKVYIGQSRNLKLRLSKYNSGICKGQPRLHRSFQKHGISKHSIDIIELCSLSELNNRERYYQDLNDCIGANGLNCRLTNTEILPMVISKETCNKISVSNKGKAYSKGLKRSEATKLKMSIAIKNRDKSWIATAQRNRTKPIVTEQWKQKIKDANSIPIIQYTRDMVFVKKWKSTMEVERYLGYSNTNISKVLCGKRKMAYKYIWVRDLPQ